MLAAAPARGEDSGRYVVRGQRLCSCSCKVAVTCAPAIACAPSDVVTTVSTPGSGAATS